MICVVVNNGVVEVKDSPMLEEGGFEITKQTADEIARCATREELTAVLSSIGIQGE